MILQDLLVWTDIETFGLDPRNDLILELGIQITDLNLTTIDKKSWLVWSPKSDVRLARMKANLADKGEKYVYDMHTKNNLFDDARRHGKNPQVVSKEATAWLRDKAADGQAMVGNSLRLDRGFIEYVMPELGAAYHYRSIDVSTIKELCRRYNPAVYAACPEKNETHRVFQCLKDSIEEFRHYRDEFLLW